MTISSLDEERKGKLKERLKEVYPRLEEMYLGGLANEPEALIFFVDQLTAIRERIYKMAIRPALKTNQGIIRTMEEFAGRANDKILRNRVRSSVLLQAAVMQMGLGETSTNASFFQKTLMENMRERLGEREVPQVEAECNQYVKGLIDGYRTLSEKLNQIAQEAYEEANREAGKTIFRALKANSYKNFVSSTKALTDYSLLQMQMNAMSLKDNKFIQFQKTWNSQALVLEQFGTLLDQVNETFMEAVKKDDAEFAAARDFKNNCVPEFFKAVAIYAPSPFDLIGTTGAAICGGLKIAYSATEAAIQLAKRNLAPGDVKDAIENAQASIEAATTSVYGDWGTETDMGELPPTTKIILQAHEKAAQEFYKALDAVKLSSDKSTLLTKAFDQIPTGGFVGDPRGHLQRKIGVVFQQEVVAKTENIKEVLEGVQLPNLSVNDLGNEKLLKRYLYLYLTGHYIEAKLKKNKNKIFKLQTNMCELLASEDVQFLNTGDQRDDTGPLGMSLPYFFGGGLVSHDSKLVRVNATLLAYAKNSEYNPFSIMLNPQVEANHVKQYFEGQDVRIFDAIKTAKEALAGISNKTLRKESYLSIQGGNFASGPLRPDGSF